MNIPVSSLTGYAFAMQQKNDKRTSYLLYQSRQSTLVDCTRKAAQIKRNKMSDEAIYKMILDLNFKDLFYSLDFPILGEELRWKRHGQRVIFPENEVLLDRLLRAKFDLESFQYFKPPFSSFMLPIPCKFRPDDSTVTGLLVNFYPYEDVAKHVHKPLIEYAGKHFDPDVRVSDEHQPGENVLSICQIDKMGNKMKAASVRSSILISKLPEILKVDSVEEFGRKIGTMAKASYSFLELPPEDLKMQFYAFKIVLAMSVYHMATEGKFLQSGMPGQGLPPMVGKYNHKTHQSFHLTGTDAMLIKASPQEHYRQWHFRNLRDERYYQGEHKEKPKGSRWVFVSDSMVGGHDSDPYTLVHQK